MSNFEYNQDDNVKDIRLREKQYKCKHPSFKCPLCGLYKDNVFEINRIRIEVLEHILDSYDKLLDEKEIVHIHPDGDIINVIMELMIEEKAKQLHKRD